MDGRFVITSFFYFQRGTTGQLVLRLLLHQSFVFSRWKSGHFTFKVTAAWKSFSWHFCDQLKKRGKKKKDPKSVYTHPAIFPASHFLFSAFTPSPCCSLLIIITSFCHKHTGLSRESNRERTFNKQTSSRSTDYSIVALIGVPLAGWLFFFIAFNSKGD